MTPLKLHPQERVDAYLAAGAWTPETWDDLLAVHLSGRPDAEAVADPPNTEALTGLRPRRLSWAALDRRIEALGAALVRARVGSGDVVLAQLTNGVDLPALLLACARIGAIGAPLAVQYRDYEVTQLATHTRPRLAVTTSKLLDRENAAHLRDILDVPVLAVDGGEVDVLADRHRGNINDCVTVCFTSGTESTPKAAVRCAGDWNAIARRCVAAVELTADDVLVSPFPMVNMAGIGGMLVPWLLSGGLLVQHHPFDLPTFLAQLATERATYTVAPPALLEALLASEDERVAAALGTLRAIGSGSAPLRPGMVAAYAERFGIDVVNFFGSTEGVALFSGPAAVPDPLTRARFFPRPPSGVKLAADGELLIEGPTVIAGYLEPDGTVADPRDEEGWLHTGDVFAEEGDMLRFVDRSKDMVIRGGMNVAPAELEALLGDLDELADVAVVGLPDDAMGETTCVVAVAAPGATPTLEGVVAHLRGKRIASYKLPERLELVAALPRNPVGKVLKRRLREELAGAGS